MSFSYTDPTTGTNDAVRFLTGDTDESEYFLEDAEISWLATQWQDKGTIYYVAAAAAEAIAAKLSREISITSEGQSLDLSQLMEKYLSLATDLREQHKDLLAGGTTVYVGGIEPGQEQYFNTVPFAFGTRMHDNREAGRQDYGEAGDIPDSWEAGQWGEFVP